MLLLALLPLVVPASAGAQVPAGTRELRVAVEPILQRSGLLDRLVPPFEAAHGVRVVISALPAKNALELGAAGGADLVWVHAPRTAVQYLNQGFFLDRRLVLFSDHVLMGPPGDPAGARGRNTTAAFRRIAQRKAPFVSRGERGGSYAVEREIWKRADVSPREPWYLRAGTDREDALSLAASRGAYVLVDRADVAGLLAKGQLQVILEGIRPLRRGYHVLEVNPHRFPKVNYPDAKAFADYLLSPPAQEAIRASNAGQDGRPELIPGAGKRDPEL